MAWSDGQAKSGDEQRPLCEWTVLAMREPEDEAGIAAIRVCDEQDGVHVTDAKCSLWFAEP